MLRNALALSLVALVASVGWAPAQTLSARRMAMGGVILADDRPASLAANVAYRGVPAAPGAGWSLPLPLGVVPLLSDLPEFDPDEPGFNIYELANLLANPPWNLQLIAPEIPGNDVTIAIGRDHLAMDLGDVRKAFPERQSRLGAVVNGPELGFGVRRFFLAAAPLVHYRNELSFNDALRAAIDGGEFQPSTTYQMLDRGEGQAAVGLHLGWAGPLVQAGDPRGTGMGLYAGARVKLMRGLAYGRTDNAVGFTTEDEIFALDPVDIGYVGHHDHAGPEGGRFGRGLDLGAVWMAGGFEAGLGVNDIATTFDWRVRETLTYEDPFTGDYVQEEIARDVPRTSRVPTTATANAAARLGRFLVAGDVVREVDATTGHLGAETWLNRAVALRAGGFLDANQQVQGTAGAGLRLGAVGLDLALATHSRNLSRERGLELGAGLAFHR